MNEWSIRGKINIVMIRLPENTFKLSRFGKVNVLKKIDINSMKDNNNKNYWISKTELITKTVQNMKYTYLPTL